MHTMQFDERRRIFHHGDLGGEIIYVDKQPQEGDGIDGDGHLAVHIPVDVILQYAAAWVESNLKDALDNMDREGFLNLVKVIRNAKGES